MVTCPQLCSTSSLKVYANVASPFAPLKLLNDPRNSKVGSNGGDENPPNLLEMLISEFCQGKFLSRNCLINRKHCKINFRVYDDDPITHMSRVNLLKLSGFTTSGDIMWLAHPQKHFMAFAFIA